MSVKVSCPFFDWVAFLLSCMNYLYILEIEFLSIAYADIFSFHMLSFNLFMFSLTMQKLVSLIRSYLFIFLFYFYCLGRRTLKTLVQFMSENILPLLSSRGVMMSWFMLNILSHFAFIFAYGVTLCSNFTDLHAAVQFPSATWWSGCLFPILYFCLPCQRLIDHRCLALFLGSLFNAVGIWTYSL